MLLIVSHPQIYINIYLYVCMDLWTYVTLFPLSTSVFLFYSNCYITSNSKISKNQILTFQMCMLFKKSHYKKIKTKLNAFLSQQKSSFTKSLTYILTLWYQDISIQVKVLCNINDTDQFLTFGTKKHLSRNPYSKLFWNKRHMLKLVGKSIFLSLRHLVFTLGWIFL